MPAMLPPAVGQRRRPDLANVPSLANRLFVQNLTMGYETPLLPYAGYYACEGCTSVVGVTNQVHPHAYPLGPLPAAHHRCTLAEHGRSPARQRARPPLHPACTPHRYSLSPPSLTCTPLPAAPPCTARWAPPPGSPTALHGTAPPRGHLGHGRVERDWTGCTEPSVGEAQGSEAHAGQGRAGGAGAHEVGTARLPAGSPLAALRLPQATSFRCRGKARTSQSALTLLAPLVRLPPRQIHTPDRQARAPATPCCPIAPTHSPHGMKSDTTSTSITLAASARWG